MLKKYDGPEIEELPEKIKHRIKRIESLVVNGENDLLATLEEKIKPRYPVSRIIKDFDEVYVYNFGFPYSITFKNCSKFYELSFSGIISYKFDLPLVEDALNIQVIKRPLNNLQPAILKVDGQLLQIIEGYGHPSYDKDVLPYLKMPSGPYLGRKSARIKNERKQLLINERIVRYTKRCNSLANLSNSGFAIPNKKESSRQNTNNTTKLFSWLTAWSSDIPLHA